MEKSKALEPSLFPGAYSSLGAERRRKPGWLWPKKAHNKELKNEPFILEADQAARSSHEEDSPGQVREVDLRVVGVRSLKWCRQEN